MKLGLIGLGKMGSNMARRLIGDGISVCGFDLSEGNSAAAARDGVETLESLEGLVAALPAPRTIWVMVPHGLPTRETITSLLDALDPGDLIVRELPVRRVDQARPAVRRA